MRRLLICGLVVLIAASVCVSGEEGAKKEVSASELWELQRKYFERISSFHVEMVGRWETAAEGEGAAAGEYEVKMTWTVEGDKYKIESWYKDPSTGEVHRSAWAYDGNRVQSLMASSFTVETNPQYPNMVKRYPMLARAPIFAPYTFAFQPYKMGGQKSYSTSLEELKKGETWAAVEKKTRGVGAARTFEQDGVAVTVGEFEEADGKKYNMECFFGERLGYYPIFWRKRSAEGEAYWELRVLETKVIEGVVVPMAMEQEISMAGKGTSAGVIRVDPESAKVNQKVEEGAFSIDVPEEDIKSGKIKYIDADAILKKQKGRGR